MVEEAGHRTRRDLADALGVDAAHCMRRETPLPEHSVMLCARRYAEMAKKLVVAVKEDERTQANTRLAFILESGLIELRGHRDLYGEAVSDDFAFNPGTAAVDAIVDFDGNGAGDQLLLSLRCQICLNATGRNPLAADLQLRSHHQKFTCWNGDHPPKRLPVLVGGIACWIAESAIAVRL